MFAPTILGVLRKFILSKLEIRIAYEHSMDNRFSGRELDAHLERVVELEDLAAKVKAWSDDQLKDCEHYPRRLISMLEMDDYAFDSLMHSFLREVYDVTAGHGIYPAGNGYSLVNVYCDFDREDQALVTLALLPSDEAKDFAVEFTNLVEVGWIVKFLREHPTAKYYTFYGSVNSYDGNLFHGYEYKDVEDIIATLPKTVESIAW